MILKEQVTGPHHYYSLTGKDHLNIFLLICIVRVLNMSLGLSPLGMSYSSSLPISLGFGFRDESDPRVHLATVIHFLFVASCDPNDNQFVTRARVDKPHHLTRLWKPWPWERSLDHPSGGSERGGPDARHLQHRAHAPGASGRGLEPRGIWRSGNVDS